MPDLSNILDFSDYTRLLIGLLAIVNPLASIPIFVTLLGDRTPKQRTQIAIMAGLTFVITLILFNFVGDFLLQFLGISVPSFQIAGGILLLMMALRMMQTKVETKNVPEDEDSEQQSTLGIVPIGIPLLAGPGAISTIIIYADLENSVGHDIVVTAVILSVALLILAVLFLAPQLGKLIGKTGMVVFNRVMGLIVAAIGIEFIVGGLGKHFPGLIG